MELEGHVLVSPTAEVPVIEGDVVTAIRTLAERGVGKKSIAREVDVAMNTVRRYLRQSIAAGVPTRPARRLLRRASPVRRMSSMRARPRATRWWCSGCWRRVTSRALPSVKVAVFGEGPIAQLARLSVVGRDRRPRLIEQHLQKVSRVRDVGAKHLPKLSRIPSTSFPPPTAPSAAASTSRPISASNAPSRSGNHAARVGHASWAVNLYIQIVGPDHFLSGRVVLITRFFTTQRPSSSNFLSAALAILFHFSIGNFAAAAAKSRFAPSRSPRPARASPA